MRFRQTGSHKLANMEESTSEIKYTQCGKRVTLVLEYQKGNQIDTGSVNTEIAIKSETHCKI